MSHSDQDIPTLTDIIRIGDEDMHHHFDAHQFRIDQDEPWTSTESDASNEDAFSTDTYSDVNLAGDVPDSQINHSHQPESEVDSNEQADYDPLHIDAVEIDQVPAELAPFDPALVEDNTPPDETDEYLELDVQEVISPDVPSMRLAEDEFSQHQTSVATSEAIRQQIDQAIDELLPDIAEQLKQNLYRHFDCQSDTD